MIHNLVARHDIWRLTVDWGTFFFSKIMKIMNVHESREERK